MTETEKYNMKIKLLFDLPVNKDHGMTKGRILEVNSMLDGAGPVGGKCYYVDSDAWGEVSVFQHECVELPFTPD